MKTLIIALALALTGCASLQHAGLAEYTLKPMVIEKQTVCCEVTIKNGKEYASLKAKVIKKGDDYSVELEEVTVQAFAGQARTAEVVGKTVEAAASLGTSVLAAPVVGSALGSGVKLLAQ